MREKLIERWHSIKGSKSFRIALPKRLLPVTPIVFCYGTFTHVCKSDEFMSLLRGSGKCDERKKLR